MQSKALLLEWFSVTVLEFNRLYMENVECADPEPIGFIQNLSTSNANSTIIQLHGKFKTNQVIEFLKNKKQSAISCYVLFNVRHNMFKYLYISEITFNDTPVANFLICWIHDEIRFLHFIARSNNKNICLIFHIPFHR